MNVFILTQPDAFYIPKLIDRFMEVKASEVNVVGAAALKGEISVSNVPDYLRLLGVRGTLLSGLDFGRHIALDFVKRTFGSGGLYSVEGALQEHGIPNVPLDAVNSRESKDELCNRGVDLLVSIACPQIIKKDLIELPPQGVINVHGALLPKYRGKLPSFWVLANGESRTGVTVHYVNEELDDGPIIVQKEVPIRADDTLHSLVLRSKVEYGAQALAEAVNLILNDAVTTQQNPASEATYFSFPTSEAIQRFRDCGRRIR